jgi:hypothetical protein
VGKEIAGPTVDVTGTTDDGVEVPVLRDGEWHL